MKEIGSEFWTVESTYPHKHWWDTIDSDRKFFVSGRTALYALLDDICITKKSIPCICQIIVVIQ